MLLAFKICPSSQEILTWHCFRPFFTSSCLAPHHVFQGDLPAIRNQLSVQRRKLLSGKCLARFFMSLSLSRMLDSCQRAHKSCSSGDSSFSYGTHVSIYEYGICGYTWELVGRYTLLYVFYNELSPRNAMVAVVCPAFPV